MVVFEWQRAFYPKRAYWIAQSNKDCHCLWAFFTNRNIEEINNSVPAVVKRTLSSTPSSVLVRKSPLESVALCSSPAVLLIGNTVHDIIIFAFIRNAIVIFTVASDTPNCYFSVRIFAEKTKAVGILWKLWILSYALIRSVFIVFPVFTAWMENCKDEFFWRNPGWRILSSSMIWTRKQSLS